MFQPIKSVLKYLALAFVLTTPTWTDAAERWASPGGGGNCTSKATACTLPQAIDAMSPGDTLIITAGNYPSLTVPEGHVISTDANPSTIRVDDGATVTFGCCSSWGQFDMNPPAPQNSLTVTGEHGTMIFDGEFVLDAFVVSFDGHNAALKNAEVRHGGSCGVGGSGNNILLSGLHIHHNGIDEDGNIHCSCGQDLWCYGIYFRQSTLTLENSTIHDHTGYGITVVQDSIATIRGNRIFNNGRYTPPDKRHGAMQVIQPAGRYRIYNNFIFDNSVNAGLVDNADILNNTIVGHLAEIMQVENSTIQNNLVFNNGDGGWAGPNNSISSNLTVSNPGAVFANAPMDDYRLADPAVTGSANPAIDAGVSQASIFTTDFEGQTRTGTWDIGADEFGGTTPPPPPCCLGLAQQLKGSDFQDSSGNDLDGTAVGGVSATAPAIIADGTLAFRFDGVDDAITSPNNAAFRRAEPGVVAWVKGWVTPAPVCHLAAVGNRLVLGMRDDRLLFGFINGASGIVSAAPLDTNAHLVGLTYDGTTLRLWVDNAVVASAPRAAISYAGNEVLSWGRGATGFPCQVDADNLRFYDDSAGHVSPNNAINMGVLFQELQPVAGVSTTHCVWTAANAPEGTLLGAVNTDRPHVRTSPVGLRCNVKRVGSTIVEHFPLHCRRNEGPYRKINRAFNADLISYAMNNPVPGGQNTTASPELPGGGFTFVPGEVITGDPADTETLAMETTLANGQYTIWEWRMQFGEQMTPGDTIQCRPHRENDTPLDSYGTCPGPTCATRTLTIEAPPGVGMVIGGTSSGGRR